MIIINNQNQRAALDITKFSGIDRREKYKSVGGTHDLINFRVGADGSLYKRRGSRLVAHLGANIHALWTGMLDGAFRCFVLAGNTVFEVSLDSGERRTVATASTADTPAEFFYYRRTLYLVDGTGLYRVDENALTQAFGYVPLVGKNWSDNMLGEINEPRNLLNNHARFDYIISEAATSYLLLDDFASAVDALYINGQAVGADRYRVGTYSPYLNVSGLQAGDRVSAYITYRDSVSGLEQIRRCTRACVFGGINTSRPMLFGGEDASVMFSSAYASDASVDAARRVYAQSDSLYFPAGYYFSVGDGSGSISAVSRQYDRLLIFTESGAWQANASVTGKEDFPVSNINTSVGVTSGKGAAVLGNSPFTVGGGAFWRWSTDTELLDECNALKISEPLGDLLTREFSERAAVFADSERGEVYFSSPDDGERIFVYSETTQAWTSISGILADSFFGTEGGVGYTDGDGIYIFDDTLTGDCGIPVNAVFEGNTFMGGAKRVSHLGQCEMCMGTGEAQLELCLDGESVPSVDMTLGGDGNTFCRARRVSARRFCALVPKVLSGEGGCEQIYSLRITVR